MMDICEILENVNLKKYNTYKLDGTAKLMAIPKSIEELENLIKYLEDNKIKYFVLGNGSNIIIDDKIYDGVIVNLTKLDIYKIDTETGEVKALCGIMLPKLCNACIEKNLKGLEWASGIPGTLGGAIYGNAGAYLSCIFDLVKDVTVLYQGKIIKLMKNEISYDYRMSMFKDNKDYIILSATLKLEEGNILESKKIIDDRKNRRLSTQPLEYPSAGSVFRNPSKETPAGKLIEDAGLKGYIVGGAMISEKHANFIVNKGNATSSDIKKIISYVKEVIKEKYNIDLICEQEILEWN